jgi:hypothetical protein
MMVRVGHIPVFRAFDGLRLLDSVQVVVLRVSGAKFVVIIKLSSDFDHTTKLSTSEVFVEDIEVPLKFPWDFIARHKWLGVPDATALL